MSEAANKGSTAFFAPLTAIFPIKGIPPRTSIVAIKHHLLAYLWRQLYYAQLHGIARWKDLMSVLLARCGLCYFLDQNAALATN